MVKAAAAAVDNNGMGGGNPSCQAINPDSGATEGAPAGGQEQRSFAFRLRVAFLIVLIPCVAVGLVAWVNLQRLVERASRAEVEVTTEGKVLVNLQRDLRRVKALVDLADPEDRRLRRNMIGTIVAIDRSFAEAIKFDGAAERTSANRAHQHWLEVRANLALWLVEPAGEPPAARLGGLDAAITAMIGELYVLDASIHEELYGVMLANTDRAQRSQDALMLALLVAVLLTAWTARRLRLAAYRPLKQLACGLRHLKTDGRTHHVEVTGDREFHAVADALNEMSDRIARQISELEALDRLKTDFVATTSHELRTPLTNVLGQLELLADGDYGDLADDQARSVAIMERNSRRLLRLIEDILALSRIEANGLALQPAATDLHALVAAIEGVVRPAAESGAVELRFDVCPDLAALEVDAEKLERALMNLVTNAIKFTPPDGAVTLRGERTCDNVIFTISDTGIGIPLDEQDRLFTPFFRSSSATALAIQGSGLGLVIARKIVEEHGGTLSLVSTEGEGTTVTVVLPLPATSPDGSPHDGDPAAAPAPLSRLSRS